MERKIQAWRIHIPDHHLQRTVSEIAVRSRGNEKEEINDGEEQAWWRRESKTKSAQICVDLLSCSLLLRLPFILPLLSSLVLSLGLLLFLVLFLVPSTVSCLSATLHYHWVSVMSSTWITLFSAWHVVASGMPRGKGQDTTKQIHRNLNLNTTQRNKRRKQDKHKTEQ